MYCTQKNFNDTNWMQEYWGEAHTINKQAGRIEAQFRHYTTTCKAPR